MPTCWPRCRRWPTGWGARRAAGPGQLPLRRRRHPRAGVSGGRRARHSRHAARPDTALGFLATPTDAFVVPHDAVGARQPRLRRALGCREAGRPSPALAVAGPVAAPGLPAGCGPGIGDCLVRRRGRTTHWPNGSSGGVPRWSAATAGRSPSTWRPRPGRGRWSRTAPWPPRSPVRTGSASRSSTPTLQHPDGRRCSSTTSSPAVAELSRSPVASLAGRGVRRGARRSVARAVRAPQRPRPRCRAGLRQRPRIVPTLG